MQEKRRRIKDLVDLWMAILSFVAFLAALGALFYAAFKALK
jgi:hypothetical protein